MLEICEQVGADGPWLIERIAEPEVKVALPAKVDEAMDRGAFGVLTIYLGGADMYLGVDSLNLVEPRVEQWRPGRTCPAGVRLGVGAIGQAGH